MITNQNTSNAPDTMLAAEQWLIAVEQALVHRGHRSTFPRRAIVEWIARRSAPFTAEDLVAALEHNGVCSRPTIYRTMEWLRDTGWIGRIYTTPSAYTRTLPGHRHWIVCTECGTTTMLGGCVVESFAAALAALDFDMQGHVLEIYGRCHACRTETSNAQ